MQGRAAWYLCNTPPKKALWQDSASGSFVVCMINDGGGIPKSSRLGGPLKSLAFWVCPK